MENSELALVEKCQNGDTQAFGQLYEAYLDKIYRYLFYRTHHQEVAEDLTSQTFIKALDKLDLFQSDQGSFSAWLYRIARNTLYDYWRTKRDISDIDEMFDLSTNEDVNRKVGAKLELEEVKKYLAKLKPDQREIIILRVWDELSYSEIASVLNKSEAACKMAFSRSIKVLRSEMPFGLFLLLLLRLL